MHERGLDLPKDVTPDLAKTLCQFYEHYNADHAAGSKEQNKIITHTAFSNLAELFGKAGKGDIPHKFKLYSTHDVFLIAILKQLGIYTVHPPPASTLFFELHKPDNDRDTEWFVKIVYNGKVSKPRGCKVNCSYKSFMYLLDGKTY